MHEHKATEWLSVSLSDYNAAKKLLTGDNPSIPQALFFTHQSAEKALKGYLAFKEHPIIKTSDLKYLVEMCIHYDHFFATIIPEADSLSPFPRYAEDNFPVTDLNTAHIHLEEAEIIYNFVKDKIENNR